MSGSGSLFTVTPRSAAASLSRANGMSGIFTVSANRACKFYSLGVYLLGGTAAIIMAFEASC